MIIQPKKKLILPRRKLIGLAAPALLLCAPDDVRAQVIPSWPTPILNAPASGPVTYTTWDPSNKSANITLSGGNLSAETTDTVNYNSVASIASFTTGAKRYWEVVLNAGNYTPNGIGFGNSSFTWTTASTTVYVGQNNNGCALYFNGVFLNASNVLSWSPGFGSGSNIGVAVDFDLQRAWWRFNGGNWNNAAIGSQNPATGTGGVNISAVTGALFAGLTTYSVGGSTEKVTANFGGSAFTYTAPSGFTGIS